MNAGVSQPSSPAFKRLNKKRKYVLRNLPQWLVDPIAAFVSSGPSMLYVKKNQASWDSFVAALLCAKFERSWRQCLQRLASGRNMGGASGLVPNEQDCVQAIVRLIVHLATKPHADILKNEIPRNKWLRRVNTTVDRQFVANEITTFSKLRIQHVVTLHLYLQEFRQLAQVNPTIGVVKDDIYARLQNVQELASEYVASVNGDPISSSVLSSSLNSQIASSGTGRSSIGSVDGSVVAVTATATVTRNRNRPKAILPLRDAVSDLLTRFSALKNMYTFLPWYTSLHLTTVPLETIYAARLFIRGLSIIEIPPVSVFHLLNILAEHVNRWRILDVLIYFSRVRKETVAYSIVNLLHYKSSKDVANSIAKIHAVLTPGNYNNNDNNKQVYTFLDILNDKTGQFIANGDDNGNIGQMPRCNAKKSKRKGKKWCQRDVILSDLCRVWDISKVNFVNKNVRD